MYSRFNQTSKSFPLFFFIFFFLYKTLSLLTYTVETDKEFLQESHEYNIRRQFPARATISLTVCLFSPAWDRDLCHICTRTYSNFWVSSTFRIIPSIRNRISLVPENWDRNVRTSCWRNVFNNSKGKFTFQKLLKSLVAVKQKLENYNEFS